jgi:hypothetical protein
MIIFLIKESASIFLDLVLGDGTIVPSSVNRYLRLTYGELTQLIRRWWLS